MSIRRMRQLALMAGAFSIGVVALLGCASTCVKKNPGPHDRGVRYYRPKPYLVIQPAAAATDPNLVQISLDYLPDYSEEYSIHVRAGLGANKTKIALDKGWNLTGLEVDVDSKVSENINAIANLMKSLPLPGAAGGGPDTKAVPQMSMTVTAYNVPLGYYESVVSRDADGVKRLYGWRYVGFAPFAQCPLNSTGGQCVPCSEMDLFGLTSVGNKMYFRRLSDMATQSQQVTAVEKAAPQPSKDDPGVKK